MVENTSPQPLRACPCCGLVQSLPPLPPRSRAVCRRCSHDLVKRSLLVRSRQRTAAFAIAALVLYPFAVTLPMLEVERLGHVSAAGILEGISSMLAKGQWFIGIVVLLCSVVFPLGKLIALLALSSGRVLRRAQHRALTYRLVEWTGRWGMLDVLLVAILVATIKLGEWLTVTPGPAALAFACCVVLSLLAAASFDPHALWESGS
jgi:paraquat-inducible protein A